MIPPHRPKIDARTHPLDRALDGMVFPTHRSVFKNQAALFNYPPALAAMVERRDRFVKNAARLQFYMTHRQRKKALQWQRASLRERRRIKQHPHFR